MTPQEVREAEETVINNSKTVKVVVCGQERILSPLPKKFGKQVNSILNAIVRQLNALGASSAEERANMTALGNKDAEIADAMTQGVIVLAQYYKWNDIVGDGVDPMDKIDSVMTTAEIHEVLLAQGRLNTDNDFLLMPLRLISQILSNTERELQSRLSLSPNSSQVSQNSGA